MDVSRGWGLEGSKTSKMGVSAAKCWFSGFGTQQLWRLGLEGSKTSKTGVSAVKMLIFRFWNSVGEALAWRVPKPAKGAFQPSKC